MRAAAALSLCLCVASCATAPLSGFDAAPPDYTFHFQRPYQVLASCGYDKIESFWHNGPTKHVDNIDKVDLPSQGEVRLINSLTASSTKVQGWEIRFRREGTGSVVVIRRAAPGLIPLPSDFYTGDIPRLLAEC